MKFSALIPAVGILTFLSAREVGSSLISTPSALQQQAVGIENSSPIPEDLSDIIASSPLLSFHRALCEVESVTYDELAVGKLLISFLEAHNFTVTKQNVPQPESSDIQKERW